MQQLDYWSDMTINAGVGHFWLGTDCPHESDPYTWTDKTRTDWFGPNRGERYSFQFRSFSVTHRGLVGISRETLLDKTWYQSMFRLLIRYSFYVCDFRARDT